jgi:signal peptidase
MEPGFYRGDLLFLWQNDSPYQTGDIVVFKLYGKEIPIVHRVIKVHQRPDDEYEILTKGDNNRGDDTALYSEGQRWLTKKDIVGRVKGYLPWLGYVTVVMSDYPILKVILLAALALQVLTTRGGGN